MEHLGAIQRHGLSGNASVTGLFSASDFVKKATTKNEKMLFVLPAIAVGTFSLNSNALAQQTPAPQSPAQQTPAVPPLVPGKLYYVPGQLFPINSATGKIQLPPEMQAKFDQGNQSALLSSQGNYEAGKGNWAKAVSLYQQALSLDPADSGALYGMGDYSLTKNDLQAAVGYYRRAVYNYPDTPSPPTVTFGESNAFRVMEYALLLNETGQQDEALTVYRHGAQLLNYMDGRPHLKLMLPDFGDGTGQIAFTPERLQALAQVGWAIDHVDFDTKGAWARLQQAAGLFPDSPVPYFYRAQHELRYRQDSKAARADFDKAAQIGSAADADAVQEMRHIFRGQLGEETQAVQKP